MDSKCPVIENVDDNLNKEEVTDTTLGSKEEEENNSNELSLSSVNDNESARQKENSDEQEQTRNLVNKSLEGDSLESSSESSASLMGPDRETEEAAKTDQTESVNNQQVKCNLILQGRLLLNRSDLDLRSFMFTFRLSEL